MYARLVLFNLGPDGSSTARSLADDLAPAIGAQTGYVSATFFGDAATGDYGFIVLWESEKDADAAGPRSSDRS